MLNADFTAALHRNMAIARAVFLGAHHLIIATDRHGIIISMNPAAERALGWRSEEVVGKVSPLVFHDPDEVMARARELEAEMGRPPVYFEVFVARVSDGESDQREWIYVRKDGSRFSVQLTVTELRDEDGSILGYVGISTDISERKRREQAEQAVHAERVQRQLADQANAAKSRFLAAASHDLRQPFQAVTLYFEALKARISEAGNVRILGLAEEALANCQNLLDALMDVSVLEAGGVRVKPERFAMAELLGHLAADVAPLAAERGLRFRCRCGAGVGELVTDRTLLARALRNLLVNAVRYTKVGGVLLAARRRGGEVLLEVWDTGIGIADEEQRAIFDSFYQVGSAAGDRKGLGLGLSVAEKTVTLLGGRMGLRSRPGRGSVFSVRLPLPA